MSENCHSSRDQEMPAPESHVSFPPYLAREAAEFVKGLVVRVAELEKERDEARHALRRAMYLGGLPQSQQLEIDKIRWLGARVAELEAALQSGVLGDVWAADLIRGERLQARVAVLEAALEQAQRGLPDAMHPGIPPKFVDGLVAAQIVIAAALGDEDSGDVDAARAVLAGVPEQGSYPENIVFEHEEINPLWSGYSLDGVRFTPGLPPSTRWTCPVCETVWAERIDGEDIYGCPECGRLPKSLLDLTP